MDPPELSSLLQVVGKNVEHELRVGVGVDMPVGFGIKLLPKGRSVDEISVLCISPSTSTKGPSLHEQSRYRKVS